MKAFVIQNDDPDKKTVYVNVTQGKVSYDTLIVSGQTLSLEGSRKKPTIVKFLGDNPAS